MNNGPIYLHTLKIIKGIEVKERYGKEFRSLKRVQNMPRFIVVSADGRQLTQYEFVRFNQAVKFAENPTYQGV